ncbi:MAG: DUF3696 domain-containing protein [Rhizobiaceae bacterium]|nr:DUF3696 domain-containing protein [Rhizobiaceae bacterium]
MLERVELSNFKCFENLNLPLKKLTLLAGLNGMGKSSVIQALLLIRQTALADSLHNTLLLDGDLVSLGTGRDVLFENAEVDIIEFAITEDLLRSEYSFEYDALADELKRIINSEDSHSSNLFGDDFIYLNAERFGPRKTLPMDAAEIRRGNIGSQGEYVLHFLNERGQETLDEEDPRLHRSQSSRGVIEQASAWLGEISPGSELQIDVVRAADIAYAAFSFEQPGDVRSRAFRATNVGFGLSYALPVIVACLTLSPGGLLLLENPEAHMHPKGQAALARLVGCAVRAGVQVIVETHSDHVMNSMRVQVRSGALPAEMLQFHYFSRSGLRAQVLSPIVDTAGRLDQWPDGFFDQHEQTLIELLSPPRP